MCASGRITALAIGMALFVGGCAGLRPATPPAAGFLGSYAGLEPVADDDPSRLYIDPDADFALYEKILIEPVTLWVSTETPLEPTLQPDLQQLADGLEAALRSQLSQEFELVSRTGLHTLRLRVAISSGPGADHRLDVVSHSELDDRARSGALPATLRQLLADAALEIEALDALSDRRLAAAVDPRALPQLLEGPPTTWREVAQAWEIWADGVQAALAGFRRVSRGEEIPAAP